MLPIQLFRQNKELVLEGMKKKYLKMVSWKGNNIRFEDAIDIIIELDKKHREKKSSYEQLLSSINSASGSIGDLLRQGKKEEAEVLKTSVANYKTDSKSLSTETDELEKDLQELLVQFPNIPHSSVPSGYTPEENEIVKECGVRPDLSTQKLPHWELTEKYNLINFELGTKLTGSGFPVYIGQGAKLQRALISYFLNYNIEAGYTEYYPPYMVNEDSARGTGQLPDKEGQMYHAVADNYYLIPTAEVPVTNVYRDEIVKESDLPIKMTAYTPCFRREAGSYGKDVRGLNRLHQFDKVEIVQLVQPEKSYDVLEEMVSHVEKLLQSLELEYRILRLCGGDMSFTSALTFDFEVYSAAQERWLEVSSTSNFENFQTNRLKARYKDANGKTHLLHSLNGSSLALPRIVACLLENHQTPEGIRIPKALQPYFGAEMIK